MDQHLRFLREMSPGTPFTILGGVISIGADRLRSVGAAARRHLETSMGVERMFGETFETYRRALATRG